jgi:hypothetical protein
MVAANGTIIETCKDIDIQIPDVVKAFINSDDIVTDIVHDACNTVIHRHLTDSLPSQLSRIEKEFAAIFTSSSSSSSSSATATPSVSTNSSGTPTPAAASTSVATVATDATTTTATPATTSSPSPSSS